MCLLSSGNTSFNERSSQNTSFVVVVNVGKPPKLHQQHQSRLTLRLKDFLCWHPDLVLNGLGPRKFILPTRLLILPSTTATMMTSKKIALTLSVLATTSEAFSVFPSTTQQKSSGTALQMGLFDGVKDAFAAPALERSVIDSERETPIDRWMGWSVVSENDKKEQSAGMSLSLSSSDTHDVFGRRSCLTIGVFLFC